MSVQVLKFASEFEYFVLTAQSAGSVELFPARAVQYHHADFAVEFALLVAAQFVFAVLYGKYFWLIVHFAPTFAFFAVAASPPEF